MRAEGDADPQHVADPHLEAKLDELAASAPIRVRVRAGTEAEGRMRGRGAEVARADDRVTFEVFDWDQGVLADELAGLAHLVTVDSPAALRDAVRDRLRRALALHEGATV